MVVTATLGPVSQTKATGLGHGVVCAREWLRWGMISRHVCLAEVLGRFLSSPQPHLHLPGGWC